MNKVAAFYQFIRLAQPEAVREEFLRHCRGAELYGTVLVSNEGVNGTLAGAPGAIDAFALSLTEATTDRPAFDRLEIKFSTANAQHFDRLKIRVKREIITFGEELSADSETGKHTDAKSWNALLEDPEVLLIDTRNAFEVAMGTFNGAINPGLTSFSEFKNFVDANLHGEKSRKIAMFCTGGIRCEKASAFMIKAGFSQVFQLQGGILRYLEEIPEPVSKWRGDCFVFDQRVALGHRLEIKPSSCHPNSLDTARGNIAE